MKRFLTLCAVVALFGSLCACSVHPSGDEAIGIGDAAGTSSSVNTVSPTSTANKAAGIVEEQNTMQTTFDSSSQSNAPTTANGGTAGILKPSNASSQTNTTVEDLRTSTAPSATTTTASAVAECTVHTFGEWEIVKYANCSQGGEKEKICSICGFKVTETSPLGDHKLFVDKAVEPTCSRFGYTEGAHCVVCCEVFVAQPISKKSSFLLK